MTEQDLKKMRPEALADELRAYFVEGEAYEAIAVVDEMERRVKEVDIIQERKSAYNEEAQNLGDLLQHSGETLEEAVKVIQLLVSNGVPAGSEGTTHWNHATDFLKQMSAK